MNELESVYAEKRELRAELERVQAENLLLKAATQAHRVGALLEFAARLAALGCRRQVITLRVDEPEFFEWLRDDATMRRYSTAILPKVETPLRVLIHGPCGLDFRIEHAR